MSYAVGGLAAVGFDESSRYLMVISSQGRGLFDCLTLQRVGRDPDDSWDWYRDEDATCEGFEHLRGARIPMFGSGGEIQTGRELARTTHDAFACFVRPARRATSDVVLTDEGRETMCFNVDVLRAFGFSADHRTFVVAQSHTLTLMVRSGAP